jgi:peroxiredoxin
MSRLVPRQAVPTLQVPTVGGEDWNLAAQQAERFALIVFYRGLHCPICRTYLSELDKLAEEFASRGVSVLAVSSDNAERAAAAREQWGLGNLTVGHSLGRDAARAWGLYISASRGKTSIGIEEPALFNEPGIFLVRPDGTLYWGNVSTMPFARPHFREILGALDFVIKNDYPARGEA